MAHPGLFGIVHSNRNFAEQENWGKNCFNSSFPMALCCYMSHMNISPVYISIDNKLNIKHEKESVSQLFGIPSNSSDLFFGFETVYLPYQNFVHGIYYSADVVLSNKITRHQFRCFEIKLTALPDNTTCSLSDSEFSCEIVVRPSTIAFVALGIVNHISNTGLVQIFSRLLSPICSQIQNWQDKNEILIHLSHFKQAMIDVISFLLNQKQKIYTQQPLVIQPVWKTLGKSSTLHDNCLDTFIWSDLALILLPLHQINTSRRTQNISRPARTIIWLIKMLYDFIINGQINIAQVIDTLTYDTKNDKAFAASGRVTHPFLSSPELTQPRIKKSEIKNIILNGGQNLLSPERRFDAIIVNTPGLF
ncbi:HindVP family restriction endonuclease [Synechococcus sp. PCC 6312]|uniref:HindVP family restriction endonuclease n=1 Tax=Synechococcus sp. (strain ATCC 27167 / PCC 6312) TaxID=195253 RepID=UPI00029F4A77|nr:HindVP family restriction endonuclease [Synechococcus sp. PCC 6312]AFY59347.1 HindVP restriction endonuclease [Synechococcus sp. PCC 6312]